MTDDKIIIGSFSLYFIAILIASTRELGTNFSDEFSHAVLFSIFPAFLTYSALAGVGLALRWIAESILRRPLKRRTLYPWIVQFPISLLILYTAIPKSPSEQFERYISSQVPQSLNDFHQFKTSGFSSSIVFMSYKLHPSEFPKVISRYTYKEEANSHGELPSEFKQYRDTRPNFPIPSPPTPLARYYSYYDNDNHIITHYTTQEKDWVLTIIIFD